MSCILNGKLVNEADCEQAKPEEKKTCFLNQCPAWVYNEWSSCSKSCGIGQQTRKAACNIGENRCFSIPIEVLEKQCKNYFCG